MTSRIRILDEITVSKIKAGEVIENSASVVKELVENSLDAESTEISIDLTSGGRQLIRVQDNGCGMGRDDALLSLELHATSKLQSVDQIDTILTMGFRGEALPSIASISKFTLITSHKDQATLISVEGGRILKVCDAPPSGGTTIEVKGLFYNVPARRRFQRSAQADAEAIEKVIRKIAPAHPSVRFLLTHNGKRVFLFEPAATEKRCQDVLGKHFMAAMVPFAYQDHEIQLEGFLGITSYTKPNRTGQYLLINKRVVASPAISYAVKDGYGTRIPSNRHPTFLLNLLIDPSLIDINVHPQKKEIRLKSEARLRSVIAQAVDASLGGARQSVPIAPPPSPPPPLPIKQQAKPPSTPVPQHLALEKPKPIILAALGPYFLVDGTPPKILDPMRAAARLIFDQLSANDHTPVIETQGLLIPRPLNLSTHQIKLAISHRAELAKLGFDVEEFGHQSAVLRGYPANIQEPDVEEFLLELLTLLEKNEHISTSSQCFAKLSMHSAKRLTKSLTLPQAREIAAKLMESSNPHLAPDGKKTFITLELDELAKRF